jgi:hypothetical protein
MLDLQEAEAVRHFIRMVRDGADLRGVTLNSDQDIGEWLVWVEGLAEDLERNAIQTLNRRRHRPKDPSGGGFRQSDETEAKLRNEVDLWRRRYIFGRR